MTQQCALARVSRATVYAQQKPRLVDESNPLPSLSDRREYVLQEAPLGGGHGSRSMVAEKWLFS
jgi:hypothetical protein